MPKTYALWNSADKDVSISLDATSLIATSGLNNWRGLRANIGKSSGKWYWEITDNIAAATNGEFAGVSNTSAPLTTGNFLGVDANGWGYYSFTGHKYNNGDQGAYGTTWGSADVIGVALDMTGGTITFYKNGVSVGQAFTGLSGTLFPHAAMFVSGQSQTANFGASAFSGTVPTGFNAGIFTEPAPVAAFIGAPLTGAPPLTVTFTDQSTDAATWAWTFGDGQTSTLQNPSHAYAAAGTYSVGLTVTNTAGSNLKTRTNYITVSARDTHDGFDEDAQKRVKERVRAEEKAFRSKRDRLREVIASAYDPAPSAVAAEVQALAAPYVERLESGAPRIDFAAIERNKKVMAEILSFQDTMRSEYQARAALEQDDEDVMTLALWS